MASDTQSTAQANSAGYPEGDAFHRYLRRRKRTGRLWNGLFLASTIVGVLVLVVLVLDIVDDAFGYVAIQNRIDPAALVTTYYKQKMTTLPRTLASEDDTVLARGVAARPNAIGFFGNAFYEQNREMLRALPLDGIELSVATVASDAYPLARPLYLYTTQDILRLKPQVAAFVLDYLTDNDGAVARVGYFPAAEAAAAESLAAWGAATGLTQSTAGALFPAAGAIDTVGSSTVAPLTAAVADAMQAAQRLAGAVTVAEIGTDAGFRRFCIDGAGDLVNASRAMNNLDISACQQNGRTPIGFVVANDGIPLAVSAQNSYAGGLTAAQVRQIFTGAETWDQIDPAWPAEPIFRFIPGVDSGTLDFFVAEIFGADLTAQPPAVLTELLTANVSAGRLRALESAQPLAARTQAELYALVESEVLKPQVAASWSLFESIFNRQAIEAAAAALPNATLHFKSWISWNFLTSPQSSNPLQSGIRTAIIGSLWVTVIAFLLAVPLGVAAAIYLEEYSSGRSFFDRLVETNINNLAGVPSIIYGMLGLAVFVRFLGPLTSGLAFGYGDPSTANGRTIVSAGLTLGLLILPLVIINGREAIRAVPRAMREGSYGLGATRWQTVWHHVLPNALPGILTGVILAVSRAFGETAPLIVVGVSTFVVVDPDGPFAKFTTLPAQIYQWTSRPQQEFAHLAAAAILVLLVLLLALNAFAIWLRNHYSRRVY